MRLLFIGDSLIEYNDWEARFPEHEVINKGIAGETVEGLQERLDLVCSSVKSPDAVFIMTGINNLAMGDSAFIPSYRRIIRRMSHAWPDAKIFIHSLLPVRFPWISNDEIRNMNMQLKRLSEDEKVFSVDIHSRFSDEKGSARASHLLDDGVHVSKKGYAEWEAVIAKVLSGESFD